VLDDGVAAFKQNDYDAALDIINKGLVQCPDDSVMHEFRALVLFAKADYQQSAATIHSVLAVGPGWNWSTLSSLYPAITTYTSQLRSLETFVKQNPQDGASRFLLAYHYMADGYPDAAERLLQQVVKLVPGDRVAADVLRMLSKPAAGQLADGGQQPTPQPPTEPTPSAAPTAKAIDPASLVGAWRANRDDGSKFEMTLTKDAGFNWKFTRNKTVEEFGGTYTVDGNVLALERKEGGSLLAGVVPNGEQKFNFKLLGAPQEDPGLNFSK
jgi:tetratricopeptide (TPR) repeat protein